jgi:hypothetical protein
VFLHVAGWPGRCVSCAALVEVGQPLVFRAGLREVRWCERCAVGLPDPISATRAYLQAFAPTSPLGRQLTVAQAATSGRLVRRRVRVRRAARILTSRPTGAPMVSFAKRALLVTVSKLAIEVATARAVALHWRGAGGRQREVALCDVVEVLG